MNNTSTQNQTNSDKICNECLCKVQKAGLRHFESKLSKSFTLKGDALKVLNALKSALETFSDCSTANHLIGRVNSTISLLLEDDDLMSDGESVALSALAKEIEAFVEN